VGILDVVVRIDKKGRVLIPKNIREALGLREKQLLRVKIVDGKLMLEPLDNIADKYYGIIKVKKWPHDLDEFLIEAIQKWWRERT